MGLASLLWQSISLHLMLFSAAINQVHQVAPTATLTLHLCDSEQKSEVKVKLNTYCQVQEKT